MRGEGRDLGASYALFSAGFKQRNEHHPLFPYSNGVQWFGGACIEMESLPSNAK